MQAVKSLRDLTLQVNSFTRQAKLLISVKGNIDARVLMEEANRLLKGLTANVASVQNIKSVSNHLSRSLSSHPAPAGQLSPAAKWKPQLMAGAKQFQQAARDTENAIKALNKEANIKFNVPSRTATMPDGAIDLLMNLLEIVKLVIAKYKDHKK